MDATRRAGHAAVIVGALLILAGLAWGLADSVREALGGKQPQLVLHEGPAPEAGAAPPGRPGPLEAPAEAAPRPARSQGWPFTGSTLQYAVNASSPSGNRSAEAAFSFDGTAWRCGASREGPPRLDLSKGAPANGSPATVAVPAGGCGVQARLAGRVEGVAQVVAPVNRGAHAVEAVRTAGGNASAGWETFHDARTGVLLAAHEWRPGSVRDVHLIVTDAPLAYVTVPTDRE